jgi:hypothetical protein
MLRGRRFTLVCAALLFGIPEGSATRWRDAEIGLFERVYHRQPVCPTFFCGFLYLED